MKPWDQRVAGWLVRPLARTPVTPNQITVFSFVLAAFASLLIATGEARAMNWGAGLFVLARFLDHFDGELARLTGRTSRVGYLLDYLAGGFGYALLFAGLGLGLAAGPLGGWAHALGAAGSVAALVSLELNITIDAATDGDGAVGYPAFAGFELEDGIYLLAPITWLGWIEPFFVLAGIGATVYTLWTLSSLVRLSRDAGDGPAPPA